MPKNKNSKKSRKLIAQKPEEKESKYKLVIIKPKYREQKPVFGFNYYLCNSKNCSFDSVPNTRSFCILFRNLKGMSSLTWQKIIDSHGYHAHEVSWSEKNLPNDIKKLQNIEEIKDLSLFQFKAFNSSSRIVGLFNYECVFEIIGLDKDHNTYSK